MRALPPVSRGSLRESPRGHGAVRLAVDRCARVACRIRPEAAHASVDRQQTVEEGLATGLHGPTGRERVERSVGSERAKVGLAVDAGSGVGLRR